MGRVKIMGINDHFCAVGTGAYLLEQEGLTVEGIAGHVRAMMHAA